MNLCSRSLFLFLVVLLVCLSAHTAGMPPATTTTPSIIQVVRQPVVIIPVTTTPTPSIGAVSISSIPSGATVIIDGTTLGTTPFTIRTLTVGSHSLLLQLSGYVDYTASFTVQADSIDQENYTLVPVPTTTIQQLAQQVIVSETTTEPVSEPSVQTVTGTASSSLFHPPVPASIQPLTITIGNHTKSYQLTTLSPYFSFQITGNNTVVPGYFAENPPIPRSFIEVDTKNVYLPGSHVMSSAEMANDPLWGDEDTVGIKDTDLFYNNTNFRWLSVDTDVTGFYQVSRDLFDTNASHWQNQYVSGLVASGPATDLHVDSDGYHYFSLNFAPIANHIPSEPPFYTGVSHLDEVLPGMGTSTPMVRIPFTGIGIYTKKVWSLPLPAGVEMIPPGELTEQELGSPNENVLLSTEDLSSSAVRTSVESALMDMPQTFYVRIVPIHHDGTAGIPTLPVKVTAVRPVSSCPTPPPPANSNIYVQIKPPSGKVSSFYMTNLLPIWIETDQDGNLAARAHFVTVATPPFCSASSSSAGIYGSMYQQMCANFGGSQPGYHFYADPKDDHWYDTVWDVITGLFGAFSQVVDAVSAAWNDIQTDVVKAVSYGITFGQFDCTTSPACNGIVRSGLSIAESSLGVPPTLPDTADLESMGTDYMAKVAAEQVGADIPDSVLPSGLEDQAGQIGSSIASSLASDTASATSSAAGSWYIPDPLYYQSHPAMAMVKVYNPNSVASDPVSMIVSDSAGLFKPTGMKYVPALQPGDSTVIPVVLEENYEGVYTSTCNGDRWTSIENEDGTIVPCYWDLWTWAIENSSNYGGDTFSVSFYDLNKENGQYWPNALTPSSSGSVMASGGYLNIDEQGDVCGPMVNVKEILEYPQFWKTSETDLNQDLTSLLWWKYTFTNGDSGRLIGG